MDLKQIHVGIFSPSLPGLLDILGYSYDELYLFLKNQSILKSNSEDLACKRI